MEKELEQFQQEAQRLKQGRKGGALTWGACTTACGAGV